MSIIRHANTERLNSDLRREFEHLAAKYGIEPMHVFGLLGTVMFIIGFIAAACVGAIKIIDMYAGNPYTLVTNSPYFYLSLTMMILGTQLFVAGFLGELISRNSAERNKYQIEETF